jgi:hypothetical protein
MENLVMKGSIRTSDKKPQRDEDGLPDRQQVRVCFRGFSAQYLGVIIEELTKLHDRKLGRD